MRSFWNLSKKCIKFTILCTILFIAGAFLYVKLSPKVQINTANNMTLYDCNEVAFFKGNESKEWISLDDV